MKIKSKFNTFFGDSALDFFFEVAAVAAAVADAEGSPADVEEELPTRLNI